MTGKEMAADTVVTLKARSQPSISGGSPLPVRPTCTSTTLPEHTPRTAPTGPRDGFRPTDFQQQGHSHFWARQLPPAHQLSSAPAGATRSHQATRRGTPGRRQGSPRQWTGWKRARSITYTRRFQTFICRCSKTYPVLTKTATLRFSRREHWSGLLCPRPGGLPDPETLVSCAAGRFFTVWAT